MVSEYNACVLAIAYHYSRDYDSAHCPLALRVDEEIFLLELRYAYKV